MRTLFSSEKRCISNLFYMKWNGAIPSAPAIFEETIAEPANPATRPWFNCDFILDFVDYRTFASERSASACSVLPNALGAELFLVVEKATLSPTALELNGGALGVALHREQISLHEEEVGVALLLALELDRLAVAHGGAGLTLGAATRRDDEACRYDNSADEAHETP